MAAVVVFLCWFSVSAYRLPLSLIALRQSVTGNIPLFISAGCSPTCIRYPFLEESEEL